MGRGGGKGQTGKALGVTSTGVMRKATKDGRVTHREKSPKKPQQVKAFRAEEASSGSGERTRSGQRTGATGTETTVFYQGVQQVEEALKSRRAGPRASQGLERPRSTA